MGVLKKGSKGGPVKDLQKKLNKNKAKPKLEEDGIFGGGTESAVKTFQKSKKLKADGIAGEQTMGALDGKAPANDAGSGASGGDAKSGGGGGSKSQKWPHINYESFQRRELREFEKLDREIKNKLRDVNALPANDQKSATDLKKNWDKFYPTWHKQVLGMLKMQGDFDRAARSGSSKMSDILKTADKSASAERKLHTAMEGLQKSWDKLGV